MNYTGRRVKSKKAGGVFRKNARPNRYLRSGAVRSRSDGQDFMSAGSNLGRVYQIGRSKSFGAWAAAARYRRRGIPRRRAGETRRSRAISILRGSKRAGLWPGSKHARRRTRLGRLGGGLGFGRGPRRCRAALGRRRAWPGRLGCVTREAI